MDADRRGDDGLVFEPEARRLRLGSLEVELPPSAGNREVLEAYVELVSTCRGTRPGSSLEVRAEDVAGLSAALDLDGTDLRVLIEEILASDTDRAVGLLIRLLQHRLVAGAALAAVGALAVGALALGGPPSTAEAEGGATSARPAPATAPAPTVDGPLLLTGEGVGLIPPVDQDASGAVLIPAEQVDAPVG